MPKDETIGLGVIGCGGFGLFAMQQFIQIPGVVPVGVTATHREATRRAVDRYGLKMFDRIEELVADPDIHLIYIATPPFLHHSQAAAALDAGKHVIVEKPLAMNADEADDLVARAARNDCLLTANLMQPYNPVRDFVAEVIKHEWLGKPLHGFFENYASDENLPDDHWFWDPEKSGGIFIEHGVHFFDLFAGWLGPGEVVDAATTVRPNTDSSSSRSPIIDQAQCRLRYGEGVTVNFYHSFTQPARLDRQEFRLVFEKGDLTLEGWVPTTLRIRAIADEKTTREITSPLTGYRLDVIENYGGAGRDCRGRGNDYNVYQLFDLQWRSPLEKQALYSDLLRRFARDQIAWIRDRRHCRRVTEKNGRDSVAVGELARRMAMEK